MIAAKSCDLKLEMASTKLTDHLLLQNFLLNEKALLSNSEWTEIVGKSSASYHKIQSNFGSFETSDSAESTKRNIERMWRAASRLYRLRSTSLNRWLLLQLQKTKILLLPVNKYAVVKDDFEWRVKIIAQKSKLTVTCMKFALLKVKINDAA